MTAQSSMVARAQDYLATRRQLGFVLKVEGEELLRFARFADSSGHVGPITSELAVRWAKLPKSAKRLCWARRLDLVRRFAKAQIYIEPETQIPPEGLLGPSYRRPPPHIYAPVEISDLLGAANRLGPIGGLRPRTYTTLFGLLACTGLRISEALGLERNDVDLTKGVLTIRHAKFGKTRQLPVHPSTHDALFYYFRESLRPAKIFLEVVGLVAAIERQERRIPRSIAVLRSVRGLGARRPDAPSWGGTQAA